MADERPESGSTQGVFNVIGIMVIGVGLILASSVYLLFEQKLVLPNLSSSITRSGSSKGVMNVIIATLLTLTSMITIFGLRSIVPTIMRDPEKRDTITNNLRQIVIPMSATLFFILFFYQFIMSGVEQSGSQDFRHKFSLLFILVGIGGIASLVRAIMSGISMFSIIFISVIGAGLILAGIAFMRSFFGM
jgi:hypothetical protein